MPDHSSANDGYRHVPHGGPRIRSDIIDVYIVRRSARAPEFLQLLRASEPLKGTWHPIMGHIESGETAIQTARRELSEEVALLPGDTAILGFWALEQVHPYYVREIDCIVLSPRFVVEVTPAWRPRINAEHSASRWVSEAAAFLWPGQKRAIEEIIAEILPLDSPARRSLAVP